MQQFAVDAHLVVIGDALPHVRGHAIDRNATGDNQFFHIAARADARIGQYFLQFDRTVQIHFAVLVFVLNRTERFVLYSGSSIRHTNCFACVLILFARRTHACAV